MDARLVTLVAWGFAVFGGLCAVAFTAAPSPLKPLILLLPLGPQLVWTGYVFQRARAAAILDASEIASM